MTASFSVVQTSRVHQTLSDLQQSISSILCDVEVLRSQLDNSDLFQCSSFNSETNETLTGILEELTTRAQRLELGVSVIHSLPTQIKEAEKQQKTLESIVNKLTCRLRIHPSETKDEEHHQTTPLSSPSISSAQLENETNKDLCLPAPNAPEITALVSTEATEHKKTDYDTLKELRSLETLGLSQETLNLLNGIPGCTNN